MSRCTDCYFFKTRDVHSKDKGWLRNMFSGIKKITNQLREQKHSRIYYCTLGMTRNAVYVDLVDKCKFSFKKNRKWYEPYYSILRLRGCKLFEGV